MALLMKSNGIFFLCVLMGKELSVCLETGSLYTVLARPITHSVHLQLTDLPISASQSTGIKSVPEHYRHLKFR